MTGAQIRDRPVEEAQAQLPIDPRIAARRMSVRRQRHRQRHRVALAAALALTVVVGLWILGRSPVLAVKHVTVQGAVHTRREAILAAAGLERPHPMLGVDEAAMTRRILGLPWVGQAHVRRHWPTAVAIDVTERVPLAQAAGSAGQAAVVDAAGRVLAVGGEAAQVLGGQVPPLPMLQGVAPAGLAGTTLAQASQAPLKVLRALARGAPDRRLSSVAFVVTGVTRATDASVTASLSLGSASLGSASLGSASLGRSLPGAITVVFGTTDRLEAKLLAMRSVLAQLGAPTTTTATTMATIDVRVVDAPVLTYGNKSSSVSTTQRG